MFAVGGHLGCVFLLQRVVRFLFVGVELVGLEVDDMGGGYSAAGIILSCSLALNQAVSSNCPGENDILSVNLSGNGCQIKGTPGGWDDAAKEQDALIHFD